MLINDITVMIESMVETCDKIGHAMKDLSQTADYFAYESPELAIQALCSIKKLSYEYMNIQYDAMTQARNRIDKMVSKLEERRTKKLLAEEPLE